MMTHDPTWQFKAKLHLLPTEQGGRKTAFKAGATLYRPQFYIDSPNVSTSCFIDRIQGREEMSPGESGDIEARLLNFELFANQIRPGTRFEIREGANPVGWGIIEEVK
ncbi:MAG TPA: hypothetical protein VG819_05990 [Rhizomicrobium sp.]|jgi:translation elongation factor EF-Tu-like GTPase|nr:hypothetical protein [Rhizomicrobium sp.]